MALVAGLALALWLFAEAIRQAWGQAPAAGGASYQPFVGWFDNVGFVIVVVMLGGLSLVGVPLLLSERFRRPPRVWGPGKLLWFASGTASWLMWPPVVYRRLAGDNGPDNTISGTCYFYGTPLMALYMTLALWAGRRLRRRRRGHRFHLSWRERFGLLLGLAWACTGLYLLAMFYRNDLFKR
jgi:hypothetical protein